MSDFDRESMMESFLYEMNQLIEQLENDTIRADSGYSIDSINEIFRVMHTIKGSSAMMLFDNISTATHAVEDLFFYLREHNPQNIDETIITDYVLEVVDFVKEELEKIEGGNEADGNPNNLIKRIKGYLEIIKNIDKKGNTPESAAKETAPVATDELAKIKRSSGSGQQYSYYAKLFFEDGSEMENVRAYTVVHNLEECCFDINHVPEDIVGEESVSYIRDKGFELTFKSFYGYDVIYSLFMRSLYIKDLELLTLDDENIFTKNQYSAIIRFDDGCEMENVRAFAVIHNLEKEVEGMLFEPDNLTDESSAVDIRENGFKIDFVTARSYDEIHDLLSATIYLKELELITVHAMDEQNENSEDGLNQGASGQNSADANQKSEESAVAVKEISSGAADNNLKNEGKANEEIKQEKAAQADKSQAAQKRQPVQHAISVSVQKLDQLLNLVGELVTSEAMVTQNPELEGLELDSFTKEARQLHKIINDIQDTVMSMRMVPLSPTFFKMHRIVRDMCKQLGKEVQLEVLGEDTEVDKNIIEHISDPLMHIIRNSVDHGIELPEDRDAKGKNPKGTIILEAKNSGGDVLISVRDDGAGFNKDKILKRAKKQGLLSKPEEEYSDKEIYQFILLPGFSTNEQVTEYSGRGVGMDVVVNNIELVGGSVLVDSVPGEGSSFVLKIPLTLAIIEGMIIKVGDEKYTIPINSIKNFLKATQDDVVFDPNGNEMIMVRGECLNFVRLKTLFGLDFGFDNIEDGTVCMLENDGQTICVLVDDLIGEQQVVVKNIPKYIKKVRGIGGCTPLSNGDISLIVDVAGFFDR